MVCRGNACDAMFPFHLNVMYVVSGERAAVRLYGDFDLVRDRGFGDPWYGKVVAASEWNLCKRRI